MGSVRVLSLSALLSFALILILTACGGAGAGGGTNNLKPTVSLTISPGSVTAGQSATLTWSSANATSVSIDNGVGTVAANGSVSITPSATTTYTATAIGSGGTATAQAQVTVAAGNQVTVSLTASQLSQAPGELVTLTWSSTNVGSVTFACAGASGCATPFTGADDAVPGPSGSVTVQMPGVSALTPVTYTITGKGTNGNATSSVTINDDPSYPTLAFAASPSNILPSQSSKLFWNSANVSTLTIDNGIGSVSPQGGAQNVSPTQTTSYTATAVGTNGVTITAKATVNLPAAGQVAVSLKAATPAIAAGQSTTLQWLTANAASLTIDNGVQVSAAAGGSATVSPTATTVYTATATDSSGHTATATARITVVDSGDPNQIKHIIIMVQENRSLDNYFGMLDTYRGMKGFGGTFDGLPKDSSGNFTVAIPDHQGTLIKPYHLQTPCHENVPPSWNQSHTDVNGGKMDQFLIKAQSTTNDPNGHRAIGYYDWNDLPYYYEAAAQFGTSDRYFGSLLGPTVPNRMYIFAGTSFGHIHSDLWPTGGWTQPNIFQRLREAGVSFRYYYQDDSIFLAQWNDWPIDKGFVYPISSYFTDVQTPASLPQVIFIERGEHLNNDEHPNNNVQNGAQFVASTIDALMKSPGWKESVYILTYDEGGGMYDHVPPVSITVPDDIAPIKIAGDAPGGFDVSGFRVPLIVISPFSKPHYVSHTNRDHTALLRFIEDRFGIASLTRRDDASPSMWEFLNLSSPAFLTPPALPAQPASGKACTQADYALETAGSQ